MNKNKTFRHHPDGWIYINELEIPLEDFVLKNPDYSLPKSYTGREYVQGKFHRIYNSTKELFLSKKWDKGDKYLREEKKYKEMIEDNKLQQEVLRREKYIEEGSEGAENNPDFIRELRKSWKSDVLDKYSEQRVKQIKNSLIKGRVKS